jgi:hypothetical protein
MMPFGNHDFRWKVKDYGIIFTIGLLLGLFFLSPFDNVLPNNNGWSPPFKFLTLKDLVKEFQKVLNDFVLTWLYWKVD